MRARFIGRETAARAACFLVASLALFAAPARGADEWTAYQHDVGHTGRSAADFDPRSLAKVWSAPEGYATPLVVGPNVIATRNGQNASGQRTDYTSFGLAGGNVNWTAGGNYFFPSQAAAGEGLVVYAASNGEFADDRLYVRDAASGALKYTVPLERAIGGIPTIHRDAATGVVSAYYSSGGHLTAVTLGAESGSVRWSHLGSYDAASVPTIAGESVVVASPGQFYAYRQGDGEPNQFYAGNVNGGGGTTPAFDAARKRLYVLEWHDAGRNSLTAYNYADNATITQLWTRTGPGIQNGSSVAIGKDGKLYAADPTLLIEMDPDTGQTLRSVEGRFGAIVTPALQDGYVWTFGADSTMAFSLNDLSLVRSLPGSRGDLSGWYSSPGAIADQHFLLDYNYFGGMPGFDVYRAVPEPSSLAGVALFAFATLSRPGRRRRR
jgi:outer membrane protein assembly factor BamB